MNKPIYDLQQLIREANKPAHADVVKAMREKMNGLLTLQIRVNAGNIVDLVELEYYSYQQKNGKTGS